MTRTGMLVPLMILGSAMPGALDIAHAANAFPLFSTNAGCLPDARGSVTRLPGEGSLGVDTLRVDVSGLPPRTSFAVFMTEASAFSTPPFRAVTYIGRITTSSEGAGSVRAEVTISEAFLGDRHTDPPVRIRPGTDHVVLRFADPGEVPACLIANGVPPFNGDREAGPVALSSVDATELEVFP